MEEESSDKKQEDPSRESRPMSSANYVATFCRGYRNRESRDEVAKLTAELRRAYMMKELQAQLEEKQTRRHAERVREREELAEQARRQQREASEEDLQRRSEFLRRTEEYRRQLDEQLMRKEREKRALAEEAREYRKTLEEMDRVQEERERSTILERKCELAARMKRERLMLERTKEVRRQEEREAEERKRQVDLEYLKGIEERSRELSRLRQEQIERRENVLLEVTRLILDAEAQKREREERLIDLMADDIRCELVIREREQATRKKRMQRELAANLEEQIVLTERSKQRFVEEDRAWAERVMRKIMEDEKIARCTAEAKRRMKAQYREDLENLIARRRGIREEEIAKIEEAVKEERRMRELETERTQEERRRLLTEHAANVANFVNRATLTAEERGILAELAGENRDTETVGDDVAEST